jgi:S-DNA-T family DNA segregation ATPase FtsK/SpoIIIE
VRTIAEQPGAVARPPAAVRTLGERVTLAEVAPTTGRIADDHWSLPLAVTPSYRPARLELPAGIHAVVSGGPGSGRSTTLVTIAHAALAASGGDVRLVVVAPRRSPLTLLDGGVHHVASAEALEAALSAIGDDPHLVLVDDAELVAAPLGQALARLADTPADRRRIVAAGRADALRGTTAWTSALRHGRTGVALQPATGDGDVFRTALPLRLPLPAAPGRGYVISLGTAQAAQIAVVRPAAAPHA